MSDGRPLAAFVQGIVAGVVTLVIFALRAAIEGQTGVTFADLWTALAVGLVVTLVPLVIARLVAWRIGRAIGPGQIQWVAGGGISHTSGPVSDEEFASRTGGMDPFDRFTDRARSVLTLAQDEAQRFNHQYIGTELLLLGLIREGEGVGARVLVNAGVELGKVRTAVEFIVGAGDRPVVGEVGLTHGGKRVIELAIDEARRFGHRYIGTEHLLLGLMREGEGIAAGVLESFGLSLDRTRMEVIRVIKTAGQAD